MRDNRAIIDCSDVSSPRVFLASVMIQRNVSRAARVPSKRQTDRQLSFEAVGPPRCLRTYNESPRRAQAAGQFESIGRRWYLRQTRAPQRLYAFRSLDKRTRGYIAWAST
jgi:hypothetical protein